MRSFAIAAVVAVALWFSAAAVGQCEGWVAHGPMTARYSHSGAYIPTTGQIMAFEGLHGDTIWLFDAGTRSWTLDLGRKPSGKWDGATSWDPNTGRVIAFGGGTLPSLTPWTFGWDPASGVWEVLNTSSPPERRGHVMALDEASGRVVLFGGLDENDQLLGDTWEWNGSEWNLRNTTAFLAREQAALAYDPVRGGVVLFGGRGTSLRNDTWLWDTVSGNWFPIAFAPPPARAGHALAYDPIDGGMLMYGGTVDGSTTVMSDSWFLASSSTAWTQLTEDAAPGARSEHVMVTHEAEGRIYLFGGYRSGSSRPELEDCWRWNGAALGWEQVVLPGTGQPGAGLSRVAVDPATGSAFMFGGGGDELDGYGTLGRMWRWNRTLETWDLLDAVGPASRLSYVFVCDESTGKILLYGQYFSEGVILADSWSFDTATETWTLLDENPLPGVRSGAAYAYDPISQRVFVYGGSTPSDNANTETWVWNGTTNEWTMLRFEGFGSIPGPTLGFDQGTSELLLLRDSHIHLWDRENNEWIHQGSDSLDLDRRYGTMVYSNLIGRLMLIGGQTRNQWYNDMWLRDPDSGVWDRLVLKTSTTNAFRPSAVELPADRSILLSAAERTYTWRCEDPYYCAADVVYDGRLDFFDLAQFLQWFSGGDERADIASPNWQLDFFDLSEYLSRFSAGCP